MNAVIMDGAEVGEECIVAAMSFVRANQKIPRRSLVAGTPAMILREVTADEIAWKSEGTAAYQALAVRSARTMQAVEPLTAPEPGRKRLDCLASNRSMCQGKVRAVTDADRTIASSFNDTAGAAMLERWSR